MKTRRFLIAALCVAIFGVPPAVADIVLFEYGFNVGGTVYPNTTLVPGLDASAFDPAAGLGTLTLTFTPSIAGEYFFGAFFDHEIDEEVNTFYNEYGLAVGTAPTGLVWEIDEPGYVFGDIYTNFLAATLDNMNGVPSGSPDDVSMALGWRLTLAADQMATITFLVGTSAPASAFYLHQIDPDSGGNVYFSTTATTGPVIPEPGTVALLVSGLLGLFLRARRKVLT